MRLTFHTPFHLACLAGKTNDAGSHVGLRILAGITTGAVAVSCAQPTDVVKVRMQAQTKTASSPTPRYTGCIHAYRTIAAEEGIRGLWKG
jgi:solute carrier family 25 (mitochondrial uncoupling protein), member 8/9